MSDERGFLKAICDNPDDGTSLGAYADWAIENGKPWQGELIHDQMSLEAGVDHETGAAFQKDPKNELYRKLVIRYNTNLAENRTALEKPLRDWGMMSPIYFQNGLPARGAFYSSGITDPDYLMDRFKNMLRRAPLQCVETGSKVLGSITAAKDRIKFFRKISELGPILLFKEGGTNFRTDAAEVVRLLNRVGADNWYLSFRNVVIPVKPGEAVDTLEALYRQVRTDVDNAWGNGAGILDSRGKQDLPVILAYNNQWTDYQQPSREHKGSIYYGIRTSDVSCKPKDWLQIHALDGLVHGNFAVTVPFNFYTGEPSRTTESLKPDRILIGRSRDKKVSVLEQAEAEPAVVYQRYSRTPLDPRPLNETHAGEVMARTIIPEITLRDSAVFLQYVVAQYRGR